MEARGRKIGLAASKCMPHVSDQITVKKLVALVTVTPMVEVHPLEIMRLDLS